MSHWNHRVMRTDHQGESSYAVHEVYCTGDGLMWTDPVEPFGETVEELRADLVHMLAALDKSILNAETGDEL